jgi:hypothetical protein
MSTGLGIGLSGILEVRIDGDKGFVILSEYEKLNHSF